jgi:hypothetical protein
MHLLDLLLDMLGYHYKLGVRVSKQEHETSHPHAATVRIP